MRHREETLGVLAILSACALNMFVGAGFYQARLQESFSPATGIFLRVLANFSCLLVPLLRRERLPRLLPFRPHKGLWLWALCGVGTTTGYFLALAVSPAGVVNFLNSGSGVFITSLAPSLAGQPTPPAEWLGALGCMAGLFLLIRPGATGGFSLIGAALALFSGVSSATGYLMVARTRGRYATETIMLHWTLMNLVVYVAALLLLPQRWPAQPGTWVLLVLAGIGAAWAQYFTAVAYQKAPASLVACLTYLTPVFCVVADVFFFGITYPFTALVGGLIVTICGCAIPLWGRRRVVRPEPARSGTGTL